eukprot:2742410-Pleurochrysis_carterae.AAC.1
MRVRVIRVWRGPLGVLWRVAHKTRARTRRATRQTRLAGSISVHKWNCCAHTFAVAAEIRSAAAILSVEALAAS